MSEILSGLGNKFLNPSHHSRYEIALLNSPDLSFKHCNVLNPAILMPAPSGEHHDCLEILEHTTVVCSDLTDIPLDNAEFGVICGRF